MRADMGKVLVERPRLGRSRAAKWPGKGYRKQLDKCVKAGDSPPHREGMKSSYSWYDRKHFNEHLGPLRRFLNSNVGRPWDKIYSEICQHVDRGNVVQKHILTHLFDYVVVNTVLINGEPCRGEQHWGYRYGEPLRTSDRRDRWYVCPRSGLLRKSKCVPRERKKPTPPRMVKLNNKQVCVDRGGYWELISVSLIAKAVPHQIPVYSMILQRQIDSACTAPEMDTVEDHGASKYAVSRRVLSRKELLAMPIPIDWLK